MTDTIVRTFPEIKKSLTYPIRYTIVDFDECEKLKEDPQYVADYTKWSQGINYVTNRKITIGGKKHTEIAFKFRLSTGAGFKNICQTDKTTYLQETMRLHSNIDAKNKDISDYNAKANAAIYAIKELKTYEEYIEFNGRKYGIPDVYKDKHRTNDCFGDTIEYDSHSCRCSTCENWHGCSNPRSTYYYKCTRCDYKYTSVRYD